MSRFGMYVKFTAHTGQRDALVQVLLVSAEENYINDFSKSR
jgi:hypothetical protein